jgi:hypothetical protein
MQSKNRKPTVTAVFVKNRTETDRLDKSETVTAYISASLGLSTSALKSRALITSSNDMTLTKYVQHILLRIDLIGGLNADKMIK